jgi:hypothetical protein
MYPGRSKRYTYRMRLLRNHLLLCAFALIAPCPTTAAVLNSTIDVTLEAWLGPARYGAQSFKSGSGCTTLIGNNACAQEMLNGGLGTLGLSGLVHLRQYELGLLYDGSFEFDTIRTNDRHVGALIGLAYDPLSFLRLELLAESGGHEVYDIGRTVLAQQGDTRLWLPYLGLRPGLSFRIGIEGYPRLILGLSAFARFDLLHREANVVTSAQPPGSAQYDVGGWNYGLVYRAGLEL